jgi:hypothetical protein
VLCRLQRRGPIRQRNQWNLAPHGAMLIADYAAFPGNIARAGDAVSDPLGRWRSNCDSNQTSPRPHSADDTWIFVSKLLI